MVLVRTAEDDSRKIKRVFTWVGFYAIAGILLMIAWPLGLIVLGFAVHRWLSERQAHAARMADTERWDTRRFVMKDEVKRHKGDINDALLARAMRERQTRA